MTVRTTITAADMLASFDKWGVRYEAHRPDWATHNRNAVGDWGPIIGVLVHNFASNIADTSSDQYLWTGEPKPPRSLPGPLSQLSIRDDGTVGLIGWGRANHGGKGESRVVAAVRLDAMPLDGEYRPTSGGTVDMNARFIGIEMLYGGNSATPEQRASIVLVCAALLDMLGPGYTGGSVAGHRESTNSRSDPQGFQMGPLRAQISARLKAGPPAKSTTPSKPTTAPAAQEDDMQLTDKVTINGETLTVEQWLIRGQYAYANLGWEGTAIDQRFDALTANLNRSVQALKEALAADAAGEPERVKAILEQAVVDINVNLPAAVKPPA